MKKAFILIVLLSFIIGCSERVTKQFIVPHLNSVSQNKQIENWTIETPSLIAFKNKLVVEISNEPVPYWLTIRSKNNTKDNTTFEIDSIGLEFVELDSIIWKTPTRKVRYKKNHFAYDFFKDQGIFIPESTSEIRLFFDAVIIDTLSKDRSSHSVSFLMYRQETSAFTPFLIQ